MKIALMKKAAAAVMALALVGGALPTGNTSLFGSPSIAMAEEEIIDTYDHVNDPDHLDNFDPAFFDEETGVLLLNGKVNKKDVKQYMYNEKVKKVSCAKGTVFPVDSSDMFNCFYAEGFDFSNADMSNVTNMFQMFFHCYNAKTVDFSNADTSKVTDMSKMFYQCGSSDLKIINLDTSNVEYMDWMFYGSKFASLDISSFNTSKVQNMARMFDDCKQLTSLDLSNFDTSNVTNMLYMFNSCVSITSIDVSSFNTSNVTNMTGMFARCAKLTSIDVRGFDTSKAEASQNNWGTLFDCDALKPNIIHFDGTSVTLDGRIEVVFHIYEKGYFGSSGSQNLEKLVMSGPNGDITITDFSRKNDDNPDGLDISYGRMKCVYPLDATQANEKVTLKAYDKNGKQLILCKTSDTNLNYSLCSYSQVKASVNDYLTAIKHNYPYYNNDAKLQILVSAIENYCNAAEYYFKGTKHKINEYSDEYDVTVEPFAPEFGNDVKISLVLNSATAVRIYTNASGVKIDGNDITPKTTKYGKCYEISDIPAHKLLDEHTLTVDGQNYKFYPVSYSYRVFHYSEYRYDSFNIAKAFFGYAKAAKEYLGE